MYQKIDPITFNYLNLILDFFKKSLFSYNSFEKFKISKFLESIYVCLLEIRVTFKKIDVNIF